MRKTQKKQMFSSTHQYLQISCVKNSADKKKNLFFFFVDENTTTIIA
jgi:hypothetical protein